MSLIISNIACWVECPLQKPYCDEYNKLTSAQYSLSFFNLYIIAQKNAVWTKPRSVDKTNPALSKWKPLVIQHQFMIDFVCVDFKCFWFVES